MSTSLRERFAGHLALARVSNLPTVITNVFAGVALANGVWDHRIWPLTAGIAMLYTAGMYLNDVCDYALDQRERPDRPLVQNLVSRHAAGGVALLLFALGLLCLLVVSIGAAVAGIVLIGFIVAYNVWHKKNSAAPLLMAVCRAMVYITVGIAVVSEWDPRVPAVVTLVVLYVIAFTVIARRGARSAPPKCWPIAVLLFLPGAWFLYESDGPWMWVAVACVVVWVSWSVLQVRRQSVGRGIMQLIAGIALLDVLILLLMQQHLVVLAAVALFGLTLFWQQYVSGT